MYQDCTRIHQVDILLETIPPSKLWKYITSIKMTHTVCDIPYAVWNNQKCLIDVIERECECSSFLFPRNRNATKQLKSCGFIQQVILHKLKKLTNLNDFFQSLCVSRYVKKFDYSRCKCDSECRHGKYWLQSFNTCFPIQNGPNPIRYVTYNMSHMICDISYIHINPEF